MIALGQAEFESMAPWQDESGAVVESNEGLWAAISTRAAEFLENLTTWTSRGRADLQRMDAELFDTRTTLEAWLAWAQDTGDQQVVNQMKQAIVDVDAMIQEHADIAAKDQEYGGIWDTLASWIQTARATFGLGLVFVPAVISVAVALAAISAIAWTVSSWQQLRLRADTVKDVANRLAAGQLTSTQAKDLLSSLGQPGGLTSFLSGLGSFGWLALGAVALFLVAPLLRRAKA